MRTARKRSNISHVFTFISLFSFLISHLLLLSCNSIDDDLSDCLPTQTNHEIDYDLQLVTNMTTELSTQLTTVTDIALASVLRNHLTTIFTDYAHDVDLSFFDVQGDSVLLHHESHIMDANQSSYTLYIPRRKYMHLAVANVKNNTMVNLEKGDRCHSERLRQERRDTVESHNTGLFTARQSMEMLEGVNQSFNVHLYMANCAATLVIDTTAVTNVKQVRVYTTGFASSFSIADSTYHFDDVPPIVRTSRITNTDNGCVGFCSVNFPSRDVTRTVIETTDPFVTDEADHALWQFRVYVTLDDGSTTESILYIRQQLMAGQLKVLKARLQNDGSLASDDQTVAVSVTLNWNNGGQYDPVLIKKN
jgi:hypothetical protein